MLNEFIEMIQDMVLKKLFTSLDRIVVTSNDSVNCSEAIPSKHFFKCG